ncbi:hypothetical protein ACR9GP_25595 [Enterobacter ludwigii]
MDQELKKLKFNVTQLAALSGVHRQTIKKVIMDYGIKPKGTRKNYDLYPLNEIAERLFKPRYW